MQIKKLILKKLIAGIIVFLMILLDCMPVMNYISQAKSNPEDSIKVIGYFETKSDDEIKHLSVCDVTDENLSLNLEIGVEGKGYVRSGTLKFDNNLNFAIKDANTFRIKDNQIKIKDINSNNTEKITIPIKFEKQEKYPVDYFNKTNKVTFSGIYVDNEGKEHRIEKNINLNLAWNEETKSKIETSTVKNINYEKDDVAGKILQTSIKISSEETQKNIPIKTAKLEIEMPQIEGLSIKDVKVDAQKLAYTASDNDDIIEQNADASYEIQDNKLIIEVTCKEDNGKIYNAEGEDIYVITYFYEGNESTQEIANSKIELTVKNYVNNIETKHEDIKIDLKRLIGGVVSHSRDEQTKEISRGYIIANTIQQQYDIEYMKKDIINISKTDDIQSIEIRDQDEYYTSGVDESIYTLEGMSNYKQIEFSKENLLSLFGEDGKIEIQNMSDETIFEIQPNKDGDENGNYVLLFETEVSRVKIRTSKPIAPGTLIIQSKKQINKVNYPREIAQNFNNIINQSRTFVTYSEDKVDDLGIVQNNITLVSTKSSATIEMDKNELSTVVDNNNVNLQIHLNNSEDTSDLYENPVFEIRLPQAIKEIKISNIDLFYANDELEIENVEGLKEGDNNIIRVSLKGTQTAYNINKASNGTIISLDTNITVDEFIGNISEMIEMYYINNYATNYNNQSTWNMILPGEGINGFDETEISYIAPEELITGQATETETQTEEIEITEDIKPEETINKNRVSSIKQDADAELLEEGVDAKTATMFISITNNTDKSYGDFRILGRIPFIRKQRHFDRERPRYYSRHNIINHDRNKKSRITRKVYNILLKKS